MGYGGKVDERERARELRAESWTLLDIARELGVSKASVSVWVRDVEFVPKPRNRGHAVAQAASADGQEARRDRALPARGRRNASARLSDRDLTMFCLGAVRRRREQTRRSIVFANSDPTLHAQCSSTWLRREFDVDESRLRVKLYLHAGSRHRGGAWRTGATLLGIPARPVQQALSSRRGRDDVGTTDT